MQKKSLGLLLAAAAAFGLYKFSKMSPEEKKKLKEKGREVWNKKLGLGKLFGKKQTATNGSNY